MKLSEMSTRQLAGALCELTAPMARIAKDENLNGLFAEIGKAAKEKERLTNMEKMGMLLEAVPTLLSSHYDDMIRIAAIMIGCADDEVEAMNGMEMIDEMKKSIDEQFMRFFKSSAVMGKMTMVKSE